MKLKLKDKTYEIEVFEQGELIGVKINDQDYFFSQGVKGKLVSRKGPQKENSYQEEFVKTASQEKEIKSPLTGEVSKLFVKKGEKIKKGQILISIFSMKMENEILSPRPALVEEIKVKEGKKVESGQVLIRLS